MPTNRISLRSMLTLLGGSALICLLNSAMPLGQWQYRLNYMIFGSPIQESHTVSVNANQLSIQTDKAPVNEYVIVEDIAGHEKGQGLLILRDKAGIYHFLPYAQLDENQLRLNMKQLEAEVPYKSQALNFDLDFVSENALLLYSQKRFEQLSALPAKTQLTDSEFKAFDVRMQELLRSPESQGILNKASSSDMGMLSGIYLKSELIQQILIEQGHSPFDPRFFEVLIQAMQSRSHS